MNNKLFMNSFLPAHFSNKISNFESLRDEIQTNMEKIVKWKMPLLFQAYCVFVKPDQLVGKKQQIIVSREYIFFCKILNYDRS